MNNENIWAISDIRPAEIEAIIRKARAERAANMRQSLGEFSAAFKRWIASFRPIRQRVPQKGALA